MQACNLPLKAIPSVRHWKFTPYEFYKSYKRMKDAQEQELVGVKEIARRAGVSIGTVDRVLHNRSGVSNKTREKILEIIKELNYQPNILARRLASKKLLTIAVLIPSTSPETDYWDAPLAGIQLAEAEVKPYGIVVDKYLFQQNDKQSFLKQAALILSKDVQGILLAPMFMEESRSFVATCAANNIPCVFLNSDLPGQESLCYVGPDLHQSGCLAAHLLRYLVSAADPVLIVNISSEIDNFHHLVRKEEGFRDYLHKNTMNNPVHKVDIRDTSYPSVKKELDAIFDQHPIKAIFVTNSRVSAVARYLEESHLKGVKLVGYDFLDQNVKYLKKGVIEFLISQQPQEQGYKSIMALYNFLVHAVVLEKNYFMPIDIITRENYMYYRN
jgi:LacI family transcriptional regulator